MIWATVSSRSCFCWLYRASPSLAAKNVINLILVLTWWCHRVHTGPNGVIDEKHMKWSIKLLSYRLGFFIYLICILLRRKNSFSGFLGSLAGLIIKWTQDRLHACMLRHSVVSNSLQLHGLQPAQTPLSMEFPRQEYWSGLPFPSPGDPPNPGIEPMSPVSPPLAGRFFTTKPPGKSLRQMNRSKTSVITYIQGSHKNIRAWDFPLWSSGEESTFQCRQFRFHPW